MHTTDNIKAFVVCAFFWLAESDNTECAYKECYCSETLLLCENHGLKALPQLINANVSGLESLDMNGNQITTIPAGSLPFNLNDINFEDNPVSEIDDTALDGSANTLTILIFSNTGFTRIPNAFGHLRALTYLSITGANINFWNEDAMKNLGKTLQTLTLQNVGLSTWPTWIRYFCCLGELTLADGSIPSLPDDALDSVSNTLTSLSLFNNSLTEVPKALSKLTNLQMLYLFENRISDLSWLPQASKLSSLSLSHNEISDSVLLSQVLRPFASSLISLDIDHNLLKEIPDFSFLTNIGSLDFTYNQISDPNSGSAQPNLYDIDLANNNLPLVPVILVTLLSIYDISLSSNAIKMIQSADFHKFTASVDLGYNLISELTDTSFPPNSGIMFLQLNNNPLIRISSVALKNLVNLRELNIRATKLTRLPLTLNVLTSLTTFDVSNSTDLICTCMEKGLRPWILTLMPGKVIGNCGQSSLYDFFVTLSLSCP